MANHRGPIPEWLTTTYMEDVLQKSLKDPNLTVENMEIGPGSQLGDNFACQIYRIKLDFIQNGKSNQISIIGKYNRPTDFMEHFSEDLDAFGNEILFFEKLLPLMNKEIAKFIPICHHIDLEHSIFFMNDLLQEDYHMPTIRNNVLCKEETKLGVEAMAVFHGSTYEADQRDPTLKDHCRATIFKKDLTEVMKSMFRGSYKIITEALPFYQLSARHSEILKRSIHRMEEEWCQVIELQDGRLNFILHGDFWKNNLLYRYNNNKVESIKLLDFQFIHYGSFASDLIHFLFTSVDVDVIINDLDELLELYYNKLRSVAPDIPNLSLNRVKEEFAEMLYYAFLLMLGVRAEIYNDAPLDLEGAIQGKYDSSGYNSVEFKEEIRKLMEFFDKRGVLDTV